MRNRSKDELGNMSDAAKKELDGLAEQREKIRLEEQKLKTEVALMEKRLFEQELNFRRLEAGAENQQPDKKNQTLKGIRAKEMEYIASQAEKVAKIKMEKNRLEIERERVMEHIRDFEKNPSKIGFRSNLQASRIAS